MFIYYLSLGLALSETLYWVTKYIIMFPEISHILVNEWLDINQFIQILQWRLLIQLQHLICSYKE